MRTVSHESPRMCRAMSVAMSMSMPGHVVGGRKHSARWLVGDTNPRYRMCVGLWKISEYVA